MTSAADTTYLEISRIFDAPRELVYRAFVDPDQLSEWFGPAGFLVPRESVDIDARVGGRKRFVMAKDENPAEGHEINATFTEVIENEVLDSEGFVGTDGLRLQLRIELYDEPGGKTRLELRQGPYTPEFKTDAARGWESSFTKLDALLKLA
jgi:uncharacterized protein YndB with AHSA1/START domain